MHNITLQKLLNYSFVITINDNRFNNFCKVFKEHNLTPLPKKLNGFTLPNDIYKDIGLIKTSNICNCSFSHIALIKLAETLDFPFICIFEDDAFPHKDIINKLSIILSNIPDNTDVIKLGYAKIRNINELTLANNIFYSNALTYGSHAYIVFKKYYADYQKSFDIDARADMLVLNSKHNNILTSKDNIFIQYNFYDSKYSSLHDSTKYLKNVNINNFNISKSIELTQNENCNIIN